MNGIDLISRERKRQIEAEGWTAEHDDAHVNSELARAASCYCFPVFYGRGSHKGHLPMSWPFDSSWWKPSYDDPVRDLVKAGALIAAEIDRRMRATANQSWASFDLDFLKTVVSDWELFCSDNGMTPDALEVACRGKQLSVNVSILRKHGVLK